MMITCNACGNRNDDDALICTSCGRRLSEQKQTPSGPQHDYFPGVSQPPAAPAPSSSVPARYAPPPAVYQAPQYAAPAPTVGFRCPYCQSPQMPVTVKKISAGGWVMFVVMLLFCFPLFWIGLLMKEPQQFCRSCGMKLG